MTINTEVNLYTEAVKFQVSSILSSSNFPESLSNLVNEYAIEKIVCFGNEEYVKFFEVNIIKRLRPTYVWTSPKIADPHFPKLPNTYYSWSMEFDAVDIYENRKNPRRNYETHGFPIYRPYFIQPINGSSRYGHAPFDRETLSRVMHIWVESKINVNPMPDTPGWDVLRKELVAIGKSYDEGVQYIIKLNAGYRIENSPLDVALCVTGQYLLDGTRLLSDHYAYCEETQKGSQSGSQQARRDPSAIGKFGSDSSISPRSCLSLVEGGSPDPKKGFPARRTFYEPILR